MTSLLFSTRGITSKIETATSQQMSMLKTFGSFDFLTSTLTDRSSIFIEDNVGLDIQNNIYISETYTKLCKIIRTWDECYDLLDVSNFSNYKNLIIYSGLFSTAAGFRRGTKRNFVFPKDSGQLGFHSVGKLIVGYLYMLKAHKEFGIPLHEVSRDPLEFNMDCVHPDYTPNSNYNLYHGYDIPRYNMKRLDTLQHYLLNSKTLFNVDNTKTIDFTFGMTLVSKERNYLMSDVKKMIGNFNNYKFYLLDKQNDTSTFLTRNNYLDKISNSRFTMILPAYDLTCFSIYRLIESLDRNCLPLIHKDCVIKEVEKSFNVDLSPLVTDIPFTEDRRLELLDIYKPIFLQVKNVFL